LGYVG
jgi:hypothetical protein